jgi:hypothetical protein
MSRLYDTVEPSVIDDVILRKAIEEQGPQEEAGIISKKDGIFYEETLSLRLDFKSIFLKIFLNRFENYQFKIVIIKTY